MGGRGTCIHTTWCDVSLMLHRSDSFLLQKYIYPKMCTSGRITFNAWLEQFLMNALSFSFVISTFGAIKSICFELS